VYVNDLLRNPMSKVITRMKREADFNDEKESDAFVWTVSTGTM